MSRAQNKAAVAVTRNSHLPSGQLGFPKSSQFIPIPEKLDLNLEEGEHVVDVATGWAHTVALTQKGNVYLWGDNRLGQLGLGEEFWLPPSRHPKLKDIQSVACGSQFTYFIDSSGKIYSTGAGTEFQLGNGERGVYYSPLDVTGDIPSQPNITMQAYAGTSHAMITLARAE